jgi:hypothetical protein
LLPWSFGSAENQIPIYSPYIRIAKYHVLQLIIQSPMTAEIHLRFAGLDDDGGLEGEGRRF